MNGFFMIKRIENNHICGVACNDIRNCCFTSKLVKELIRDEVRDKPFVKQNILLQDLEGTVVGR